MTDRWALSDLRATAIMDATRNARVAERNSRLVAEGLAVHNPAHNPGHGSVTETAGLAVPASEPASTIACEHESTGAREHGSQPARGHGSTSPDGWLCLEFTVPVEPRGWSRCTPIVTRDEGGKLVGRPIKSQAECAYQHAIGTAAKLALGAEGIARDVWEGPVRLSVVAYLRVPKSYAKGKRLDCLAGRLLPACKPDADNVLKSVMDALSRIVWCDDKQVVAGSCLKVWAETGSLYVRVQAL